MGVSKFTLRMDEGLKRQLEERAKQKGISLNYAISQWIAFASTVDRLVDTDSHVVIENAKGYEPEDRVVVSAPGIG